MNISTKLLKAAAGSAGGASLGVDDVFSTFLNNDGSSNQTITNGIDLAGEGGLVWGKSRNLAESSFLVDSARGKGSNNNFKYLRADATGQEIDMASKSVSSFNSNGFTFQGADDQFNSSGNEYVYWTFRKAEKFFTCVKYTGNGVAGRTISHDLNNLVGMLIIKCTSHSSDWSVQHRMLLPSKYLAVNETQSEQTDTARFHSTAAGTSTFSVGSGNAVNGSGRTYVAYLFAHHNTGNPGEFGPSADQDIIKCGSYTGNSNSTGPIIDLGFEPQWIVVKRASNTGGWFVIDAMRGWTNGSTNDPFLRFDSSQQEYENPYLQPLATGFQPKTTSSAINYSGDTYIYMAIAHPISASSVPTDATKVFHVDQSDADNTQPYVDAPFPVDFGWWQSTTGGSAKTSSRLTQGQSMLFRTTDAESANSNFAFDYMNGWYASALSTNHYGYSWKRAPGYFDVVAEPIASAQMSGPASSSYNPSHNLGVVPEMIWVKDRDNSDDWAVYHSALGTSKELVLNTDTAESSSSWAVAAGNFNYYQFNNSTGNAICYLFATAPGVSKVGSYTGNGSTQNIDCGFTSGARFVLIKRSSNAGDWYVFDSTRGIVSGNDPYLRLNTNAAESQSDDLDPLSSGFTVNQSSASINFNTHTYIFYAIA